MCQKQCTGFSLCLNWREYIDTDYLCRPFIYKRWGVLHIAILRLTTKQIGTGALISIVTLLKTWLHWLKPRVASSLLVSFVRGCVAGTLMSLGLSLTMVCACTESSQCHLNQTSEGSSASLHDAFFLSFCDLRQNDPYCRLHRRLVGCKCNVSDYRSTTVLDRFKVRTTVARDGRHRRRINTTVSTRSTDLVHGPKRSAPDIARMPAQVARLRLTAYHGFHRSWRWRKRHQEKSCNHQTCYEIKRK